jgi:2-succinyl-5-enolpyruvyl-6-hydroxy-3-cyclohexene-1-carboxylate synthase
MADHNAVFAAGLVDAFARLGVEHVCLTPGSRSSPLALAFADEERITDWMHHDERSAAFFALGVARTTRRPSVVVTTSGTAAAEPYPAVVEARYGRVPLIVITSDRPVELRDVGAPQTIDQRDMFGRMVVAGHDVDVAGLDPGPWVGPLGARLVGAALGPPPGPVHLNVAFREPLVPTAPAARPDTVVPDIRRPRPRVDPNDVAELAARVSGRRGVLVAGPQDSPEAVTAAIRFAGAAGWPIVADPLSGLRAGAHDPSAIIGHADALAWEGWLDRAAPEMVIRFGALPTSKPVWRWMASRPETPQVFLEPFGWRDPTGAVSTVVRIDPGAALEALTEALPAATANDWLEMWRAADLAASQAVDRALDAVPFPNEPAVARLLGGALPDPSNLWVASSMPIRDIDAFFGTSRHRIRLLANRGANGIDGFLSSGFGSAASDDAPTVLLAGDLSVVHDLGALATAARLGIAATVVVLDNDGGGIFHFLPQSGHPRFEQLFGTPHGLDLVAAASALGVTAARIDDQDDLEKALGTQPTGPRLLEVPTDRFANVGIHRAIREAVRDAIERL